MPDRPEENPGKTIAVKTGCGKIYVVDNTNGDYPEVFIQMGKAGGCATHFCQALARVASFYMRTGVEAGLPLSEAKKRIVHAWKGIRCPSPTWSNGVEILSCADAVAKVLEGTHVKAEEEIP